MNLLTILIPTYNRPTFLAVALKSIRDNFGKNASCIIGDNGNHEITESLLLDNDNFQLEILHLKNPPGGTYMKNLQILINAANTEWVSILHDDDFFTGNTYQNISKHLENTSCDFIFSDHWVASDAGEILEQTSIVNSKHYGRDKIPTGKLKNLALYAINQNICLDGFFIRSEIIKSVKIDFSRTLTDYLLLIECCNSVKNGFYSKERLFAYRLNASGLTANGIINNSDVLYNLTKSFEFVHNDIVKSALKEKILARSFGLFKSSIKRLNIKMIVYSMNLYIKYLTKTF